MLELSIEDPDQPEVCALLGASDALLASLYPAQSNHLLALDALRAPDPLSLFMEKALGG